MENSSFGRLIGALASPGKTFRSLAERPTWAVALIVLLAAWTAAGALANQRIDEEEMRRSVKEQIERRQGQATPDQVDQAMEMTAKINAVSRWLMPLVVTIIYLVVTLLFWMAFRFFAESEISYKTSFSVLLHAFMPLAVSAVLSLPVILSRESIGVEEARTGVLASHLAAFAPEETGSTARALLSSLDFFSLWTLVLLVIGYRAAARTSTAAAASIVLVLWGLYVAGKVGLSALFG